MASQTDKKEEFRRYLEKSNVLATLTNILTDLFEMETRPDDPGHYLHQKFGDSLRKAPASPSQPKNDDQEAHKGDASTNHVTPTPNTEMDGSSKPNQDLHQLGSALYKIDTAMSEPTRDVDDPAATITQAQPSGTDQIQGQEASVALQTAHASTSTPKENAELSVAQASLGESAQPTSTTTLGQPSNLATLPTGSSGQSSGDPITSNNAGLSPSPASAQ